MSAPSAEDVAQVRAWWQEEDDGMRASGYELIGTLPGDRPLRPDVCLKSGHAFRAGLCQRCAARVPR